MSVKVRSFAVLFMHNFQETKVLQESSNYSDMFQYTERYNDEFCIISESELFWQLCNSSLCHVLTDEASRMYMKVAL